MIPTPKRLFLLVGIAVFAFQYASAYAQPVVESGPSVVKVVGEKGRFQLIRNGKPYPIHGVGGNTHLDKLVAAGGNSIRTWSTDGLSELLDKAHQRGLTVCVGMWLGHERHGFDYQNEAAVSKQLNDCLEAVRKHKDHPAVLMWAVGNEMEGSGNNPAIWYAVNHIAREVKRIDPNHPTMTVIAELGEGENKLHNIEKFCPDIDVIGVNSYGGISSVAERYRRAGVKRPYIVTEHGPHGPWEVGKTPWGAPIEASSTEKGNGYATGYRKAVQDAADICFGSYAFLWGNKQETTATWFGMLLPDASRLAAVDVMSEAWTGKRPRNLCPRIAAFQVTGPTKRKPGESLKAALTVSDPENDDLQIEWILRQDSGTIGVGGDRQTAEPSIANAVDSDGPNAVVTMPKGGGGYRLFVYVRDGQGGAATANVPLYVDAPIKPIASPKASLPLVVYADGAKPTYVPSGYMGNTGAIAMTLDSTENPNSGDTCLKVEYKSGEQWGGVLWQSPPNDWDGTQPGGFDLTGASALEFYARGKEGGETVSFVLGVIESNKPYRDSSKSELKEVRLTDQWQKLRIPLLGRDLRRIKTGFGWSLAGQGKPVTFYLDDVRYVGP